MNIEGYFEFILLIGAFLTFLMSFFLWFFPRNTFANRVLGALIAMWGLTALAFVVQSKEFFINHPHLFGIGTSLTLLFFPLIYVYIRTYLYEDARKLRKIWMHGIPSIVFLIILSPFILKSGVQKSEIIAGGIPLWMRSLLRYSDLVIILQGLLYTIWSFRILHHFQYFRERHLNRIQINALKWLRQFVTLNAILWAVGASGAFMELLKLKPSFDLFKIFYSGLTVLNLWLGTFALRKPYLFSMNENLSSLPTVSREKRSNKIDKEELKRILEYFDAEKPYLNSKLNLQDISDNTGLNKNRISEILNKSLQKSFYEVVNEYRLKEALRLIDEGFQNQHTLTHLAEEAGFNSKATFYRIFKKMTGKTPSDYIASK